MLKPGDLIRIEFASDARGPYDTVVAATTMVDDLQALIVIVDFRLGELDAENCRRFLFAGLVLLSRENRWFEMNTQEEAKITRRYVS
jgi:hypothetical protein